MRAFVFKPTAIAVALALSVSSPLLAQQAPAGASKASSSAVGGVSAGTIGAAVAVVAAAAALSGGSGGASSAGSSESAATTHTQAAAAASEARTSLIAAQRALATLTGQGGFTAPATSLFTLANDLQARAEAAASNLALANTVAVAGVVNPITGVTICAAANTCTAQEKLLLAFDAARLAKAASQALFAYLTALENASLGVTNKNTAAFATATSALAIAKADALRAQTSSNAAIVAYNALATSFGIVGTVLSGSTGTTGTVGPSGTVRYARGSN